MNEALNERIDALIRRIERLERAVEHLIAEGGLRVDPLQGFHPVGEGGDAVKEYSDRLKRQECEIDWLRGDFNRAFIESEARFSAIRESLRKVKVMYVNRDWEDFEGELNVAIGASGKPSAPASS